jgi:predicted transcriptional regulator YdeE
MQDFTDQAAKNGVVLLDKGICQFCGADYQRGVFECMENYNNALECFDFNDSRNHLFRFLSVDAHALQHPEIHGRWSNHFHLTRLHLILNKKQTWDYNKSPLLSDYLNRYKSNKQNEFLKAPESLNRGKITAKDLNKVTTAEECAQLIIKWAEEVYHSWSSSHGTVSQIADVFLDNNYTATTQVGRIMKRK